MRRWRTLVTQLLLFLLLYLLLRTWMQADLASGNAPALEGITMQGEHFSLQQPRSAPLLIHFWATWCPICKLEQDSIEAISADHPVITVAMQSGNGLELEHHMAEQHLRFPTLNDPDGAIAQRFGVEVVPTTFILSTDNQIRFAERGFTTEWGLRLRMWITKYLYRQN